jgi:catechol 2,3-dioxygenase-like lactoylglutathione lyase family enzyme
MIKMLDEIEVITLFVEDLTATKQFYQDVFGSTIVFEDNVSAVMTFKNLLINLLAQSEATKLVEPMALGTSASGVRMMFTIKVDDVDATCVELKQHKVPLLSEAKNQPWGRRTATFADPSGNIWEVAQLLHP